MTQSNTTEQPAGDGPALSDELGLAPTRAALDELAAQALAQMDKARDFPANTCSASRHLAEIAESILRGQECHQLAEDPQHCAESMAWTVAALWYARTEIAAERERWRLAGHFRELPSAMSHRLWEQAGHEAEPGTVALYERA